MSMFIPPHQTNKKKEKRTKAKKKLTNKTKVSSLTLSKIGIFTVIFCSCATLFRSTHHGSSLFNREIMGS